MSVSRERRALSASWGIHARPASMLVEVSNRFASEFVLINLRNERQANMKSVLSIIAADIRNGDRCSVQVSGTDEKAAYTSIHNFIEVVLPTCDVPIAEAPPTNQEGMPRVLRSARAVCYSGLPASPGIARGAVLVI